MNPNHTHRSLRILTFCALLVAMSIVFSRVLSISTGFLRFNLGSLPVVLAAVLFGPGAGFVVGALADAIGGVLAAVICIQDPLREEAPEAIRRLKELGISKVVMMTGDSERTAASIARRVGVDEYYAEVLPEDKARFVENEKASGKKVIMIGDGINDSPALSAADAGIAISDGAEIAREIADITIVAEDLRGIVMLRRLSDAMMRRIQGNYKGIVSINGALIALGVAGLIQPTTSALLHNTSTMAISAGSMRPYLPTGKDSPVLETGKTWKNSVGGLCRPAEKGKV